MERRGTIQLPSLDSCYECLIVRVIRLDGMINSM